MDDQPLVMWKVFGACALHWLAIWCVCAPTSKASSPSRGNARRTASMAAYAVNVLPAGRKAVWKVWRCSASIAELHRFVAAGIAQNRAKEESKSPVT